MWVIYFMILFLMRVLTNCFRQYLRMEMYMAEYAVGCWFRTVCFEELLDKEFGCSVLSYLI